MSPHAATSLLYRRISRKFEVRFLIGGAHSCKLGPATEFTCGRIELPTLTARSRCHEFATSNARRSANARHSGDLGSKPKHRTTRACASLVDLPRPHARCLHVPRWHSCTLRERCWLLLHWRPERHVRGLLLSRLRHPLHSSAGVKRRRRTLSQALRSRSRQTNRPPRSPEDGGTCGGRLTNSARCCRQHCVLRPLAF